MITVTILSNLNSMIKEEAPFLKIVAERHDMTGEETTYFYVRLQNTKYIYHENHPVNITAEFKNDVENFLYNNGVEKILWNNNLTTFWEAK